MSISRELKEFQLRRDIAGNFLSRGTVLLAGEPGYATDTGEVKIGDGAASWADLPTLLWVKDLDAKAAALVPDASGSALNSELAKLFLKIANLDAQMTAVQQNPASEFRASQDAAYVSFGPTDPSTTLPAGTEYVWNKTDGAGTLIDIVTGVA